MQLKAVTLTSLRRDICKIFEEKKGNNRETSWEIAEVAGVAVAGRHEAYRIRRKRTGISQRSFCRNNLKK